MTLRAVRDRVAFAYLVGRLDPGALPAAAQVRAAFDHVDAGLPLLADSPRIPGVGSSVHCARSLPPFGRLLSGERRSGLRAAVRQGYAIAASPDWSPFRPGRSPIPPADLRFLLATPFLPPLPPRLPCGLSSPL